MFSQTILLIIIFSIFEFLYKTDVNVLKCDKMLYHTLYLRKADVIACCCLVADVVPTFVI